MGAGGQGGLRLDQPVEELGDNFSAGQRQLLCIARALLKVQGGGRAAARPSIVCLDEATSAVDAQTDALVQRAIRVHLAGSTVLVIAHRLRTIVDSDRVLVLEQGRVAEFDTPQRLLANKGSAFARMLQEAPEEEEVEEEVVVVDGRAAEEDGAKDQTSVVS